MEDVVHAVHGVFDGLDIAHVAYVKLEFVCILGHTRLKIMAHIVLLLLVAGENADFSDVGVEESSDDGVAKRTSAARDEQLLIFEHTRLLNIRAGSTAECSSRWWS